MIRYIFFLVVTSILVSCEVKPQEITFGQDACHFCKMTILDRQHAAELVTIKGKAFKYDAIECMMNHLNKWDQPELKFFLVSDYKARGTLTDATKAHYLISEAIPSPMGEFLTAFKDEGERNRARNKLGGTALGWGELKKQFGIQ